MLPYDSETLGAAQPSAERVGKAVARLQKRIASLQNEFSLEHVGLYTSFVGLNFTSSVGLNEIVAFLTTQVPESISLSQAIVNLAQAL